MPKAKVNHGEAKAGEEKEKVTGQKEMAKAREAKAYLSLMSWAVTGAVNGKATAIGIKVTMNMGR